MRHVAWIIASLAVLGAAPALARPFYVIKSGSDAWTIIDPDGVERKADIAKAWSVRVERNIFDGNPPQPGYVRTLTEYGCDQPQTRWREVFVFSRSGAQLAHKTNDSAEWTKAGDRGESYVAWRIACAGGSGDSVVEADSVAKVVIKLMAGWDAADSITAVPTALDPRANAAAPKAGLPQAVSPKAAPAAKPAPPKAKP